MTYGYEDFVIFPFVVNLSNESTYSDQGSTADNLDIDSKNKIKFFLKTTQEIIKDRFTQDHMEHLVKLNSQKKEISVTQELYLLINCR